MLMRSDPFRELDRLTQQLLGTTGTRTRPTMMLMDAWREGDRFVLEFDLPGVAPDSIDLDVERVKSCLRIVDEVGGTLMVGSTMTSRTASQPAAPVSAAAMRHVATYRGRQRRAARGAA